MDFARLLASAKKCTPHPGDPLRIDPPKISKPLSRAVGLSPSVENSWRIGSEKPT
jgi:hypothetical protein